MVDLNKLRHTAEHVKNTYATPYDFEVLEAVERAIAAEAKVASYESRMTLITNVSDEWIAEFNATNKPGTLAILLEGLRPTSIVDEIINFGNSESAGPTERQVYQWFQESTIAHHIEESGHHISKRAMFVAKKAWECALKQIRSNKQDVIVKNLVTLLKAERDCTWVDQDIHQAAIDAAIVKFDSHVTDGGVDQKAAAPEHREIPVNDPIFYFVAQHYPLTAQIVERIYRECIHHCESREVPK